MKNWNLVGAQKVLLLIMIHGTRFIGTKGAFVKIHGHKRIPIIL